MSLTTTIYFPRKLVIGSGTVGQLSTEVLSFHPARVFIIGIEPLRELMLQITRELEAAEVAVQVDTSIVSEPGFSDFRKIMVDATTFDPDLIIGIGGGSVLDVAKLVAAQLGNSQQLEDYVGIGLLKGRGRTLVAVPATAGTGSEVSPNAILVDEENQKKGIISPHLVPDLVFLDPGLTFSVPPSITAATGIDALTHCLEAYTNRFAQPFIDMFALEGVRLISANIVEAVTNGNNRLAREKVAMGSLLGGFCLGPVNTAGVHALSYPLGSMFHLAHGLSNALLLPAVMEFNIPVAPERYADIAVALGAARLDSAEKTALAGVKIVREMSGACGIPPGLRAVNIPETAFEQMADDALKIQRLLKNNPRPIGKTDAISIYKAAY